MSDLSRLRGMRLVLEEADSPVEDVPKNDMEAMKKGSVSASDIIDKLNSIRSGKSFKDPQVKSSLDEYFASLKMPEKVALFAFLKGISQVLTGEISPKAAVEPEDPAPAVKMQKAQYVKKIKPTIIRKRIDKTQAKPVEDTSAPTPAPIQPKK